MNFVERNVGEMKPKTFIGCEVGQLHVQDTVDIGTSATVVSYTDGTDVVVEVSDGVLTKDSLEIPEGKTIEDISAISTGANVVRIDARLFERIDGALKAAYLPEVLSIGNTAFGRQGGLTSVYAPKVTDMGEGSFQQCSSLTEISFPQCSAIGRDCFMGCDGAETIMMSALLEVPEQAFMPLDSDNSAGAKKIDIRSASYIGEWGIAYNTGCTELCCQSLTAAGANAFYGDNSLKRLVLTALTAIPDNLQLFDYYHSYLYIKDGTIEIPNVSSIGRHGMFQCTASRIEAPNLTAMPNGGMKTCWFLEEAPTQNLTIVGKYSLAQCTQNLKYVDLASCEALSGLAFYQSTKLRHFYAPELTFMKEEQEGSLVNAGQFRGCADLRTVVMPKCGNIPSHAFQTCGNLEYVSIPNMLSIGSYAFSGCENLKVVNFGNQIAGVPIMYNA